MLQNSASTTRNPQRSLLWLEFLHSVYSSSGAVRVFLSKMSLVSLEVYGIIIPGSILILLYVLPIPMLSRLISKLILSIEKVDFHGITPLLVLACYGVIGLLVEMNAIRAKAGQTPPVYDLSLKMAQDAKAIRHQRNVYIHSLVGVICLSLRKNAALVAECQARHYVMVLSLLYPTAVAKKLFYSSHENSVTASIQIFVRMTTKIFQVFATLIISFTLLSGYNCSIALTICIFFSSICFLFHYEQHFQVCWQLVYALFEAEPPKRLVVDPKWEPVEAISFSSLWRGLVEEADHCHYIGFDMEWTTQYERNKDPKIIKAKRVSGRTATIQLSTASFTIIFRICNIFDALFGDNNENESQKDVLEMLWGGLASLLRSDSIFKVGVGINGDREKLESDYPELMVNKCVDLAVLHHMRSNPEPAQSLKSLCELYTQRTLAKDVLIIRSNWGGHFGPLSPSQIEYAANDSEASFDVCMKILETLSTAGDDRSAVDVLSSIPPTTTSARPREKKKKKNLNGSKEVAADWCKGRAKPYYDNISVLNPEGNVVFTVDKSKANWYVKKKGLAKVVEWRDEADGEKGIAVIQLTFSPDTAKYEDSHIRRNLDYFKLPKENMCVVCGEEENLVRFAVVPLVYRKHFPSVYMSHNSYDLLLLCTRCFSRASDLYEEERNSVAVDFGIPLAHLTIGGLATLSKSIKMLERSIDMEAATEDVEDDLVAHHLHPRIKLSVMKEFYEMQQHRNTIIQIIRYANALSKHYQTLARQGSSTGADSTDTEMGVLPEERFDELQQYLEENAYTYPFCSWHQDCAPTASSPEGVESILQDGTAMYQDVLRRYWLECHPEILSEIPSTTRAEKVNGSRELPAFESHGFFVVRALLKKYGPYGNSVAGKNREHAVGQFIYRWRKFFLAQLKPEHLPEGWVAEDGILR
eukprot:gene1683-1045_t